MTDLTFGPKGAEWHYSPTSKTYSLTHNSPQNLKIATSQGPEDTFFTLAPESTALVIVDMQNFFLHPRCRDHPNGLAAVQPTIATIRKCREVGIRVIWLNWGLRDDDLASMPAAVTRAFMGTPGSGKGLGEDLGEEKGRMLVEGSWNAEIYGELKKCSEKGDTYCRKNRMSGLWGDGGELGAVLNGEDVRTVLWAGVNTDQCVLGSLVDAYNLGWNCVLVEDCCGTGTEERRSVSVRNVQACYGFVTESKAIVAAEFV